MLVGKDCEIYDTRTYVDHRGFGLWVPTTVYWILPVSIGGLKPKSGREGPSSGGSSLGLSSGLSPALSLLGTPGRTADS